ncbi:MAG TPA: efflux transporter outer membrane subunit [Steroidobacteraceae bacterium]|nr:efflux transporter outer membrane subunit [Steroidobacteraceae bacterium]
MSRWACLAIVAVGVGVAGCLPGPDYVRPDVSTPEDWRIDYVEAADAANTKWWEQFGDPVLDELVDTALQENLDVRIAAARVDQFVGALAATRSPLFPQVGYGVDASRAQLSRVGQPPLPAGADRYFSLYQASLGASWQIDLFGRVRRLSEAAQARVFASEQARRGVVLTLVSSVTSSYIVLRGLDRQLEIAEATAANFEETVRIFEARFSRGIASEVELMQIRSQAQQALAAIPAFEQAIAAQENLLSILLGRSPGPIPRGKTLDELVAPPIPAGLPAALLERRPDILQAEQNLVAANANVGAAKALYFPDISITGVLGSVSTDVSDLLSSSASTMLLGGSVAGPIFTFGGISGQVDAAAAGSREAELAYRQTVLNALRETDNALTGSQKKVLEFEMQKLRVESLREFARLSTLRFDRGVAGYLDVLVAENELFAADLASARLQAERYVEVVNVYQAMGGGWVDLADSIAPGPQSAAARP